MDHKKQHFVPQIYLNAWVDPQTPPDQDPYVWIFPKSEEQPKRKSPKNIFWESDFYTIKGIDGARDLVLEHGLSQLESQFSKLRNSKLAQKKQITSEEKSVLCAFAAAMYARTKARRDHWKKNIQSDT